jgi:hypothetical protein
MRIPSCHVAQCNAGRLVWGARVCPLGPQGVPVLRIGGLLVLAVGSVAILADSRFAAGVTLTVGGVLYLTGMLGAWWNRRD